jgi:hypothetical protein
MASELFGPRPHLVKSGGRPLQGVPPAKNNQPLDADGNACRDLASYRLQIATMSASPSESPECLIQSDTCN